MAMKRKKPLKRGPKGGKKHTPGRDHDRKSHRSKAKRFGKKAQRLREEALREAERQWRVWDSLSEEQKKFLEDLRPKLPRPANDEGD